MSYSIQKIMVPVDLSDSSLNALHTAAALAKRHNSSLHILNVTDNSFNYLPGVSPTYNKSSKNIIDAIATSVCNEYDIDPEVIIAEGPVSQTILKTSFDNKCDLIVMGSDGASGEREYFIGSNTYNVIKHTFCPVLVIRPGKKVSEFKSVLYPIRPVKGALSHYDVVCHFINAKGVLNVLGLTYISPGRQKDVLEEIVDEIKVEMEADRVIADVSWSKGLGVAEDILHASMEKHVELLVVNSILDVSSKEFFLGPNAQRIINQSRNPVLAIPKAVKTNF